MAKDKSTETNIIQEIKEEFIHEKATILIVEDDFYNTMYLKEVLSAGKFDILCTEYGVTAIDISNNQDIDIILMDIRLPDISGYEAIETIKKEKPNIIIIAQTAYATSTDHFKAIEIGCNDYISKPIKGKELLSKINHYLATRNKLQKQNN